VKSALDTSLLIDVREGLPRARAALSEAVAAGALLVCGAVFAELLAGGRPPDVVSRFLDDLGVEVDAATGLELWTLAGERHARYAARRRAAGVPDDRRLLLADFIVGAHGVLRADCLVTRDGGAYAAYFPELTLHRY